MNMAPVKAMAKSAGQTISKHSPTILAVVGVVGTAATAVLAVKATPKALMEYEDARYDCKREGRDFRVIDGVKACWKNYIPAAGAFVLTSAAIVSGNAISIKRIAGLKAALDISETALIAYKDQIVEDLGQKKADQIDNHIEQKKVNENPPTEADLRYPVVMTDGDAGREWIKFGWNGQLVYADRKAFDLAVEKCNHRKDLEGWIRMTEVIETFNECDIPVEESDKDRAMGFDDRCDIEFIRDNHVQLPENSIFPGKVVWVFTFRNGPFSDYRGDENFGDR